MVSHTAANFDTLPSVGKLLFIHEILDTKSLLCWQHVYQISKLEDWYKKRYNNLPTCVVLRNNCENRFTTSTLTPSQGLKNCLFTMKFLAQHALYNNNIHAKFKGQKIYTKKIFKIYQHICPPFASVTACNLEGIEWHSWRSFVPLTNFHSLSRTTFNTSKFLGYSLLCCTTSFSILQTFSIELRSGEFAGQLSFSRRRLCLHSSHILLRWTDVPSSISTPCGTWSIKWTNWPS